MNYCKKHRNANRITVFRYLDYSTRFMPYRYHLPQRQEVGWELPHDI